MRHGDLRHQEAHIHLRESEHAFTKDVGEHAREIAFRSRRGPSTHQDITLTTSLFGEHCGVSMRIVLVPGQRAPADDLEVAKQVSIGRNASSSANPTTAERASIQLNRSNRWFLDDYPEQNSRHRDEAS